MLSARCLLPLFGLCLMLEHLSAFLLPESLRPKRDVNWLDQEFFRNLPELPELADLSPGDAGDTMRDLEGRHIQSATSQSATFHAPLERLSVHQHQNQRRRKPKDKRKRVPPLDSIGSSPLMSSHWSRKDAPEDNWE